MRSPTDRRPVPVEALLAEAPWLRRLAHSLLTRSDEADDLAQDVLTDVLRTRPAIADGRLRPWLRSVVRRKAARRATRDRLRFGAESIHARPDETGETVEDAASSAERLALHRELAAAIDALPAADRDVIVWRWFHEQDTAWIAARLGISPAAARKRVSRALARLRDSLARSERGARGWTAALAVAARLSEGQVIVPLDAAAPPSTLVAPSAGATAASALVTMSLTKLLVCAGVLAVLVVSIAQLGKDESPDRVNAIDERAVPTDTHVAQREPTTAVEAEGERREVALAEPDTDSGDAALSDGHVIVGRVVDHWQRPVAGVRVVAWRHGAPRREAVTGDDGRYVVGPFDQPLPGRGSATVVAAASDGFAGVETVYVGTADVREWRAADLVIAPGAGDVVVRVTSSGSPVADAEVILDAGFRRLVVGIGRTGEDGRVTFRNVPAGSLRAVARTDDRHTGTTKLAGGARVGRDAMSVAVQRGRSVRVRTVQANDPDTPAPGVRIVANERVMPYRTRTGPAYRVMIVRPERALPHPLVRTDAAGEAVVHGLPKGPLQFDAWAANGEHQAVGRAQLAASENEVVIQVENRALRSRVEWPIAANDEVEPPADGTVLSLRERPGASFRRPEPWPANGVVERGRVVVRDVPPDFHSAIAATPDGSVAILNVGLDATEGDEARFERASTITVRARDTRGVPVTGWNLQAFNQGNNAMGDMVPLDDEGVGRLEGLIGRLVDVKLMREGQAYNGLTVGAVDLREGGAEFDFVVPPQFEATLRISVGGIRRFPEQLIVRGAVVLDRDPVAAEVRIAGTLPKADQAVEVSLHAGRAYAAKSLSLTASQLMGGMPIDVELSPGGVVLATVPLAPEQRIELTLDRRSDGGEWATEQFMALDVPNADDDVFKFGPLEPGEYRLHELDSGLTSDPFFVAADGEPTRMSLDVSTTGFVRGRIVSTGVGALSRARVAIEVEDGVAPIGTEPWRTQHGVPPHSVATRNEGMFEIPIQAGRSMRLRAWHPLLVADGEVVVTGPTEGVELRLREGALATFTASEDIELGRYSEPRILLLDASVGPNPSLVDVAASVVAPHSIEVLERDGLRTFTFGGFKPGRYSLWIDLGVEVMVAPKLLSNVALGARETKLGELAFDAGATVRFAIETAEGASPPRIVPSVRSVATYPTGVPLLMRYLNSRGERDVPVSGLVAGEYTVSCMLFDESHPIDGLALELAAGEERVVPLDLSGE